MKKIIALALAYSSSFQPAHAAIDFLDSQDARMRSATQSNVEWLYNIGVLKGVRGQDYAVMVNLVDSPVFEGFLPFTLIPLINFYAKPLVQVLVLDLKNQTQYGFEARVNSFDSQSLSASTSDHFVIIERKEVAGTVQTYLRAQGISRNQESIGLEFTVESTKPRALFSRDGWVDNGSLGEAYYASRTGRKLTPGTQASVTIGPKSTSIKSAIFWEDHQLVEVDLTKSSVIEWDWFAVQIEDHSELMIYHLFDNKTGKVYRDFAERVKPDGGTEEVGEVFVRELSHITSEGFRVPYRWLIEIPEIEMKVEAEHIIKAPWLKTKNGLISGRMLEGPTRVQGGTKFGAIQMLWAEYFNADFFK